MSRIAAAVLALLAPAVALAADGAAHRGWWTLAPPVLAIGLALVTRKVLPSLAAGVLAAGLVAASGDPIGGAAVVWDAVAGVVSDVDKLKVTAFIVIIAAAVGVLTRSGAMRTMVARFEGLARGRRGAMVAAWGSGAIVFFDDYANCLVVGNAMQSVFDRFGVSRAKLAYIVDATAAPVATLAVVSTWVGYQVSVIQQGLPSGAAAEAFSVFLASLPYSFYSWFTLVFVGAIAISGRDFGPMRAAEAAAHTPRTVTVSDSGGPPWWLAPATIALLVGVTFAWMLGTGRSGLEEAIALATAAGETPPVASIGEARLFQLLEHASTYDAMILGSTVGLLVAAGGVVLAGGAPRRLPSAAWHGVRPVLEALVILLLAWSLAAAIQETGAQRFLGGVVSDSLDVRLIPAASFVLAAATAFATGSSYSTMAILVPLVISICVTITGSAADPITAASAAAILGGSVLGDHASPISDTTVLSSIGSGVDLVTHVRTQLPYVLVVGVISGVLGYLPAGFGASPWLLLPAGAIVSAAAVWIAGRPPAPQPVRDRATG